MSSETLRLFVAIDLPPDAVEALLALRPNPVPGLRRVGPDQMHLTLHYVGPVEQPDVLEAALARVPFARFALDFAGVGSFARNDAEYLWAGVVPSLALTALHTATGVALRGVGHAVEERPYTPHITVARGHGAEMPAVRDEFVRTHARFELRGLPITRFSLYTSRFVEGTPLYERRRTYSGEA